MNCFKLLLLFGLLCASSCTPKFTIQGERDITELEQDIQNKFYKSLQKLRWENGINIVPQNLSVTFDHTGTSAESGGFVAFTVVTTNYTHTSIDDESATFILTPTKLSDGSGSNKFVIHDSIVCPFELEKDDVTDTSLRNLNSMIEKAAISASNLQNLGPLDDHQVTIEVKFTISKEGDIQINPLFSIAATAITKFTGKVSKTFASSNDIKFTYDVVKSDQSFLMSDTAYYNMRKRLIEQRKGPCIFFKTDKFDGINDSISLNVPTPINQNDFSACVAYAIGYTCLSTVMNTGNEEYKPSNEYSPDFIYVRNMNLNKPGGLNIPAAMDFVLNSGDCTIKELPREVSLQKDYQHKVDSEIVANNLTNSLSTKNVISKVISGWLPLNPNDLDQIRICLANKEPVIAAFLISSSFTDMWQFGNPLYSDLNIWSNRIGPFTSAHCVCIIGFNNKTKLFKVQNSWGNTNKSKDGIFYVTYDMVQKGCFNEAYSFIPNSSN